jgi:hypothetical protein
LLSAAFLSSDAISYIEHSAVNTRKIGERVQTLVDILLNLSTGKSPLTTLSFSPGLFLSFKLTNNERILLLYSVVVPPNSVYTAFSTPRARPRIKSVAIPLILELRLGNYETEKVSTHERPNQTPEHHR